MPRAGGSRSSRRSAMTGWPSTSACRRWVEPRHWTSVTVPVSALGPAPRPTRCGRTQRVAVAPGAAVPVGTVRGRSPSPTDPSPVTVTGSRLALPTNEAVNSVRGRRYSSRGVPQSWSRARSMTAIRSARVSASTWSWVTYRIETSGNSRCSRASSASIPERRRASRAESGSSRSRTPGRMASARAMATRCCWPPESSRGWRSAYVAMPTSSRASATRPGISAFGVRWALSPNATLSLTLRCGKRA